VVYARSSYDRLRSVLGQRGGIHLKQRHLHGVVSTLVISSVLSCAPRAFFWLEPDAKAPPPALSMAWDTHCSWCVFYTAAEPRSYAWRSRRPRAIAPLPADNTCRMYYVLCNTLALSAWGGTSLCPLQLVSRAWGVPGIRRGARRDLPPAPPPARAPCLPATLLRFLRRW
jgi:hypothetical protein